MPSIYHIGALTYHRISNLLLKRIQIFPPHRFVLILFIMTRRRAINANGNPYSFGTKFSSPTPHQPFLDGQYTACGTKNRARNGNRIPMSSSPQKFSSMKPRKSNSCILLSQFPFLKNLGLQLLHFHCLKYSGNGGGKSARYHWILLVCPAILFFFDAANNDVKGIQMGQTMRFTHCLARFRGQVSFGLPIDPIWKGWRHRC